MEPIYIDGHEVELIVDPANRVTVARMRGCADDAQRRLFAACQMSVYYPTTPERVRAGVRMRDSYRATARCHPDDAWDDATGIGIAVARLEQKHREKLAKRLDRAAAWLMELAGDLARSAETERRAAAWIDPLRAVAGAAQGEATTEETEGA